MTDSSPQSNVEPLSGSRPHPSPTFACATAGRVSDTMENYVGRHRVPEDSIPSFEGDNIEYYREAVRQFVCPLCGADVNKDCTKIVEKTCHEVHPEADWACSSKHKTHEPVFYVHDDRSMVHYRSP